MMSPDPQILIVDDDVAICDELCELLGSEGFTTRAFVGGIAALDALTSGVRPRLILLDVQMPLMDGRDLLAELQRDPALGAIPVVVMTAGNFTAAPGVRLLRKPLDIGELLRLATEYSSGEIPRPDTPASGRPLAPLP